MHHTASFPKNFWWLAAALLIFFLGLGCYGWKETFEATTGHYSWSHLIFHTLELADGEAAVVVDHLHEQHWAVLVAEWGVKAVLLVAIFQSAAIIFSRKFRKWRFRNIVGHQVYVGLGPHNCKLALQTLHAGGKVAVIESDDHHPTIGELEDKGALVLCGSPGDRKLLRAARTACASRLVVATGKDELNVEVADHAATVISERKEETGKSVEILVCVDSPDLREVLRGRWALLEHSPRLNARLVSFLPVALRDLLMKLACEMAVNPGIRARGPRILVVAERAFTEEFLPLAISFLQFTGDARPHFWVCTQRPGEARRFARCYPAVDLVAQVCFLEEEADTILLAGELEGLDLDGAVICMENETTTLTMADRMMHSPKFHVARVRALTHAQPLIRLMQDERLEVFPLLEHGGKSPEFGDHTFEQSVRENHEAYLEGLSEEARKTKPNAKPWELLPEAFKESNRWAVLHRAVKRTVWEAVPAHERDSVLELLSRSEHQRWMAEKIMDGWIAGKRDNARKIHDDIRPYDDLDEAVKSYDRDQVRKALVGLI
jgi:RyR domain/TrkA-N domain